MSIVAFSVESLAATNDSGRFVRGRKRCSSQTAKRHQSDCAIRRLELPAVSFTSGRLSVCFQRSVDATDAGFDRTKSSEVSQTDAYFEFDRMP